MLKQKSIVLVGLGPHSKRIYMNFFVKHNITPTLIIDTESKKNDVYNYLDEFGIKAECLFVSDAEKDNTSLSINFAKLLIEKINSLNVTHAIISTEPKAHFSYIKFFLDNKVSVLTDKPITAPINVSYDIKMVNKIEEEYLTILKKYEDVKNCGVLFDVMCQRRWHLGYKYIFEELKNIVVKYGVPITSMQIMHSDGMWNMPDEFLYRENHPYKYGYGKAFHSGYHFIDLAAWLLTINDLLPNFKANEFETYASAIRPSDFMNVLNKDFYFNVLQTDKFNHIFDNINKFGFDKFGEIDIYSTVKFLKEKNVISTVVFSLMQNGFSRRSWVDLPLDTYKSNGRVRHEYLNVTIGPLMNIQVHSYQAKEIKEFDVANPYLTGECDHFDILIFRNCDIIGGDPFEKITLSNILKKNDIHNYMGHNELAREKCFLDFLNNNSNNYNIRDFHLGIRMTQSIYASICADYNKDNVLIKAEIPNISNNYKGVQ